ncbi:MAG TPA: M20/M25/M40 family metallo-hydrolase [Thermoanaerobaculia bacterium]|jgi:acetylornithine deacetylase/succinyl-diaminopimelate desuccinylase-like protein
MRRRFPVAVFVAVLVATAGRGAPAKDLRDRVRAYRAAHELAILRELADLLTIPNVASDDESIRRNAAAIVSLLEKRGVRATLLNGEGGPPAVYGELTAPRAERTVVFYAHYDGQPVDPARWTGNPWEPVMRDGPLESGGKEVPWSSLAAPVDPSFRLYARSASDDKAPIVALLTALDALRDARISPSVNVKFFFEGEEEAGSPHLAAILSRNRERLAGDLWLFCDGPVHQTGRKLVFFGTRGVTDVEITAYGALRRLHSGHYGNWSPNPAVELARLIASMRDREGQITIPGFSEDVRPATEEERRAIREAPEVDGALKQELGLARTEGGGERIESRILLPALNVRGLAAADVGERATNSIPTEATVSIDFRLVPDQTPGKVQAKVEDFLRAEGFFLVRSAPDRAIRLAHAKVLRVEWGAGYPPSRTPMDRPVSRAVVKILSDVSGAPVVRLPTLGGSGPNYLFEQILKSPVIGVPIVNHDNNQHASNENVRVGNLWEGIEMYAALMAELGRLP